jgi:hypothetical protein
VQVAVDTVEVEEIEVLESRPVATLGARNE